MENYIVINGKKIELTEEQLINLGIKPEKNKYEKMFELPDNEESYFFINDVGNLVYYYPDILFDSTEARFICGNVCKDKDLMHQRALHEILNRLLWRASIIAGELNNPWEVYKKHYYIYKDSKENVYRIWHNDNDNTGVAYFPTKESAEDAIENIVKPFMKQHPDFVW